MQILSYECYVSNGKTKIYIKQFYLCDVSIYFIISSSGKNLSQSFYHKMETDNGLSLHIV